MEPMIVFPPGARVYFKFKESNDAVVTGVCIRSTGVTYEVAWWNGCERKEGWVTSEEIALCGPYQNHKKLIGFVS